MSDEKSKPKRCAMLPYHPNIMPGWGCCTCRVFNGDQRQECKECGHKRCDKNPDNQAN